MYQWKLVYFNKVLDTHVHMVHCAKSVMNPSKIFYRSTVEKVESNVLFRLQGPVRDGLLDSIADALELTLKNDTRWEIVRQ
jgi:hypothetical protein